jgi:hypothetical protein
MFMAGLLWTGIKGLLILIVAGQTTVVLYVLLSLLSRAQNPGRDLSVPLQPSRPVQGNRRPDTGR